MLSKLDAFEMWVYRRVLKISWTEKITNEEVLRRMGTDREIVRQFKTRKLQYLGHPIRHNSSKLQLIEGKIEGRRSRGRPRNTWATDITTTKGMKYYQLKRSAEDRRRWHGLVVNLAQEKTSVNSRCSACKVATCSDSSCLDSSRADSLSPRTPAGCLSQVYTCHFF